MGAITLTVDSYNNQNITQYSGVFIVEKMNDIRANQNKTTAVTITEAGDTGSVMSAWTLTGNFYEGQVLYWSVETATDISATTRRVRIYSNVTRTHIIAEGTATIANSNSGTVYLSELNESGVKASVLVTIGGGGLTDDNDSGNKLTLTNVTQSTNLQLDGESQFMYQEGKERLIKVTVAETPTEIQTLIDAIYS